MNRLGETIRPVVADLIARAGATMILRRVEVPSYDPATGDVAETTVDIALKGVIEEVETGHPDGVVRRGDRVITVAAQDLQIDPSPGDDLIVAGAVHRIVSVTATYAGDRPAVFRLHIRR
ncbi:MAG: hypothetical protein P1U88_06015 [Thalassobaculaceae bacterium]|nr:hypothetical protein [Thalassobaculaceae bacterium]